MFWIIVVHIMITAPDGSVLNVPAVPGQHIAYVQQKQCEALAGLLNESIKGKVECRLFKVDGGKDAASF